MSNPQKSRKAVFRVLRLVLTIWSAGVLASCATLPNAAAMSQNSPSEIRKSLDGEPTRILVLGTNHFSGWADLEQNWLEPLIEPLKAWAPDTILIERMPSWQVEMIRAHPHLYPGVLKRTHGNDMDLALAARSALGIGAAEIFEEIDRLAQMPELTAPDRTRLALLYISNFNVESAGLQWSYLTPEQRRAAELSGEFKSVLDRSVSRKNETSWIAIPVAKALNHQELILFDDQIEKATFLKDEVIGKMVENGAIENVLEDDVVVRLNQEKDLRRPISDDNMLDWFLYLNSEEYGLLDADGQWGSFLRADQEGYGRQRVALWEARNLRMVANVRESVSSRAGGRALVIVGAAHKSWMDDYLEEMSDVEVVNLHDILPDVR